MTPIEEYVRELDRALVGPRRIRGDLVREARHHLVDAAESAEAKGALRDRAEREAVAEFGPVDDLAPSYQAVVSAGRTRRDAFLLLVVTMLQPFAWGVGVAGEDDPPAGSLLGSLNAVVENLGVVMFAVAVVTALALGIGLRYVRLSAALLRTCMIAMAVVCLLVAALATTMSVVGGASPGGLAYAAAVAVVPLSWIAVSSLRGLRPLDVSRR